MSKLIKIWRRRKRRNEKGTRKEEKLCCVGRRGKKLAQGGTTVSRVFAVFSFSFSLYFNYGNMDGDISFRIVCSARENRRHFFLGHFFFFHSHHPLMHVHIPSTKKYSFILLFFLFFFAFLESLRHWSLLFL